MLLEYRPIYRKRDNYLIFWIDRGRDADRLYPLQAWRTDEIYFTGDEFGSFAAVYFFYKY